MTTTKQRELWTTTTKRGRNGWPSDWQERMRDGWHDLMSPGDDCGGTPDWCLAPNGVECAQHDQNGDRRG